MNAPHPYSKTSYMTLNRLCQLSGRSRVTILLRMRDGEITADAQLDLGDRALPLFAAHRVDEFKRLPLRKAAPSLNPML